MGVINYIFIGALYFWVGLSYFHLGFAWLPEKFFKFTYESFLYVRNRDRKDIAWAKNKIKELKR